MKYLTAMPLAFVIGACAHAHEAAGDKSVSAQPISKTSPGPVVDGLARMVSAYSHEETVARLTNALEARGVTIMAVVDHAANADGAGLTLAPTTLVIFGNPAAGTQLMQVAPTAGIDLPMKALITERNGMVLLEYNQISHIARRHGVPADLPVLAKIEGLLAAVSKEATGQ